jgi:Domain of unknown function (DUF5655)
MAADRYSEPVESRDHWSVDRHLAGKPENVVNLYERFVELVAACGPFTYSVSNSAITFKGAQRGFAGAKPRNSSLDGCLDLQREVQDDRFRRVSPYTKRLFVHQFRITNLRPIDESFTGWAEDAYQVGRGAHRDESRLNSD